ncbi:MAG: hypothetical protein J1F03_05620 [Oscillospiraceae bacterium]|nr:hypothetical protein [Oscillospiraceae bacterium]
MFKKMMAVSIVSLVMMFVSWGIFLASEVRIFFTLGIIAVTVCFHFSIRLVIGGIIDYTMKNQVDYTKPWFEHRSFENGLYKTLRVKKWKDRMPTANEEYFSLKEHSLEEIIMAGCQAEIVHELCAVAGFLTLFFAIPFGDMWLFLLTAAAGAVYDMIFVIIQRYNRPRLMKAFKREMCAKTTKNKENDND